MAIMHMNVSIDYLYNLPDKLLEEMTTQGLSADTLRRHFRSLQARGFECYPLCDATDEKGYCTGHPSKRQPVKLTTKG